MSLCAISAFLRDSAVKIFVKLFTAETLSTRSDAEMRLDVTGLICDHVKVGGSLSPAIPLQPT
jgi:hypothetical protein